MKQIKNVKSVITIVKVVRVSKTAHHVLIINYSILIPQLILENVLMVVLSVFYFSFSDNN